MNQNVDMDTLLKMIKDNSKSEERYREFYSMFDNFKQDYSSFLQSVSSDYSGYYDGYPFSKIGYREMPDRYFFLKSFFQVFLMPLKLQAEVARLAFKFKISGIEIVLDDKDHYGDLEIMRESQKLVTSYRSSMEAFSKLGVLLFDDFDVNDFDFSYSLMR